MEAPALSLTEEDLTEVKKDALKNLRVYLCQKIIAERHFDHLLAKQTNKKNQKTNKQTNKKTNNN
jgi:B-cell CLL/lymphoma protein 10